MEGVAIGLLDAAEEVHRSRQALAAHAADAAQRTLGDLAAIETEVPHAGEREVPERFAGQAYDVSEHILRRHATQAAAQDAELSSRITPEALTDVLAEVPDEWLEPVPGAETPDALRARYVGLLVARLAGERPWLPRAEVAR